MKKDKIQEAYESMLVEKKIKVNDIKTLKRRLDEIEAVIKAGESPFELLSYLRTDITKLMGGQAKITKIDPKKSGFAAL